MATFRNETRATQYQQKFKLPPNFPEVLKEFTREVLRSQPGDIYEWSANYFKEKALEDDGVEVREAAPRGLTEVEKEMGSRLEDAFAERDSRGEGTLFTHLCKAVLMESAQLTEAQALFILTHPSLPVGPDGTINYTNIVHNPEILQQVTYFQSTGHEFTVHPTTDPNYTIHGLTSPEVCHALSTAFKAADESNQGLLTIPVFREALCSAHIQLTERDISILILEAPRNGDSLIPYTMALQAESYLPLLSLSEVFTQFNEQ